MKYDFVETRDFHASKNFERYTQINVFDELTGFTGFIVKLEMCLLEVDYMSILASRTGASVCI